MKEAAEDKFIAMVSARAETDLRLSDFAPRSSLVVPAHDVRRAKYPARSEEHTSELQSL